VLFEEVHISLNADHVHPFERVVDFLVSAAARGDQELVVGTAELDDVVAHHNTPRKSPRKRCLFRGSECNLSFSETSIDGVAPFEGPVGFALDTWFSFDGTKQV
jgi:hypothetical protein